MDGLLQKFREAGEESNKTVTEVTQWKEMKDILTEKAYGANPPLDNASFSSTFQSAESFAFITRDLLKILAVIVLQVYSNRRDIGRAMHDFSVAVLQRLLWPFTLLCLLWLAYFFEYDTLKKILITLCELYYIYLILFKNIRERQVTEICIILTSIALRFAKFINSSDFVGRLVVCASIIWAKYNGIGHIDFRLSGLRRLLSYFIQNPLFATCIEVMFPEACQCINLMWLTAMIAWLSINELTFMSEWNQFRSRSPNVLSKLAILIIHVLIMVL
ncbi:hypothetical protein HOLleu_24195 [Holothuria leucospilota]|uniref:Uncharacterized protein n=1 Tax=Holothuria leucospilota TaxID=206669 RepID=A0A9Q1BWA0_HOLLE|nr:hypothetical protein HOLleu_24195 [Holothuria leucospilota]